jgi:hypothetical protein
MHETVNEKGNRRKYPKKKKSKAAVQFLNVEIYNFLYYTIFVDENLGLYNAGVFNFHAVLCRRSW